MPLGRWLQLSQPLYPQNGANIPTLGCDEDYVTQGCESASLALRLCRVAPHPCPAFSESRTLPPVRTNSLPHLCAPRTYHLRTSVALPSPCLLLFYYTPVFPLDSKFSEGCSRLCQWPPPSLYPRSLTASVPEGHLLIPGICNLTSFS